MISFVSGILGFFAVVFVVVFFYGKTCFNHKYLEIKNRKYRNQPTRPSSITKTTHTHNHILTPQIHTFELESMSVNVYMCVRAVVLRAIVLVRWHYNMETKDE